jgi:hypothetical protein
MMTVPADHVAFACRTNSAIAGRLLPKYIDEAEKFASKDTAEVC